MAKCAGPAAYAAFAIWLIRPWASLLHVSATKIKFNYFVISYIIQDTYCRYIAVVEYKNCENSFSGCSRVRKMQSSFADRLRRCSHLWALSIGTVRTVRSVKL